MYVPATKFQGPAIVAEKQLGFGISVQIKKESSRLSLTLQSGILLPHHSILPTVVPTCGSFLLAPHLAHRTGKVYYILTLPSAL